MSTIGNPFLSELRQEIRNHGVRWETFHVKRVPQRSSQFRVLLFRHFVLFVVADPQKMLFHLGERCLWIENSGVGNVSQRIHIGKRKAAFPGIH
jgi:hypothetical protein